MPQNNAIPPVEKDSRQLRRRRTFRLKGSEDIVHLAEFLRLSRVTGKVELNFSQGTCSTASVEERAELSIDDA